MQIIISWNMVRNFLVLCKNCFTLNFSLKLICINQICFLITWLNFFFVFSSVTAAFWFFVYKTIVFPACRHLWDYTVDAHGSRHLMRSKVRKRVFWVNHMITELEFPRGFQEVKFGPCTSEELVREHHMDERGELTIRAFQVSAGTLSGLREHPGRDLIIPVVLERLRSSHAHIGFLEVPPVNLALLPSSSLFLGCWLCLVKCPDQ